MKSPWNVQNQALFLATALQLVLFATRFIVSSTVINQVYLAQQDLALSGVYGASSLVFFYVLGSNDFDDDKPVVVSAKSLIGIPMIALFMVTTTALLTIYTFAPEVMLLLTCQEYRITLAIVGCSWVICFLLLSEFYLLLETRFNQISGEHGVVDDMENGQDTKEVGSESGKLLEI